MKREGESEGRRGRGGRKVGGGREGREERRGGEERRRGGGAGGKEGGWEGEERRKLRIFASIIVNYMTLHFQIFILGTRKMERECTMLYSKYEFGPFNLLHKPRIQAFGNNLTHEPRFYGFCCANLGSTHNL